jgi:hypothetical protein
MMFSVLMFYVLNVMPSVYLKLFVRNGRDDGEVASVGKRSPLIV